jgi:DNA polymerase I
MKATRQDAYDLFHRGTLALAEMERVGIRIDTKYLTKAIEETEKTIKANDDQIKDSKIFHKWKKRYGKKTNMDSNKQFVTMMCEEAGYKPKKEDYTEKGQIKGDEYSLRKLKHPFVKAYYAVKRYKKVLSTYLKGTQRELCGDRAHCFYNLAGGGTDYMTGGAKSYRGSCSMFNFQNWPIRNKTMGGLIRPMIIPSKDNLLVEVDYKILEVRTNCFYNKDRTLITYVTDESTDMHRDLSQQVFMISPKVYEKHSKLFKKTIRDCTKNKFTFPQFYGSIWFQCAPDMWEMMKKGQFKIGEEGKLIQEHLRDHGITKLGKCKPGIDPAEGTFAYHVRKIERDMWRNRFPEYAQWRKDFYQEYLENGYFDLLTGFRCEGYFKRNQVTNFPGQGVAFHCLLWDIIQITEEIKKRRMKARLVGQIHDSLIGDVPEDEVQEFLDICQDVMTKRIVKHWDWINVPMVIEVDASEENWFQKQPWNNKSGIWELAI